MGYIIVTRNPRTKHVIAITEATTEHDEHVSEFDTEQAAGDEAAKIPACRAWGYQVLEIN